jgi:phosphomannomutase/phosphomannomutase/phosphoglucomutase
VYNEDGTLKCFKAYDVRGRVPEELNAELVEAIGRAFVAEVQPKGPVAVGRDIRTTGAELVEAVIRGLTAAGASVHDIGVCGTEMVYHAAAQPGMGGGIMVTASHNPAAYNGAKLVRAEAVPISADTGLECIERRVRERDLPPDAPQSGTIECHDVTKAYLEKVLSFVRPESLKPLKVVVNAGNGAAGPFVEALAKSLPVDLIRLNYEPDGTFPNGVPNPMLPENRAVTADAVRAHKADLGVAWDGDFDRCFFFDERGSFVEGYYMVGLLAERLLRDNPGGRIVYDPRLTWNTIEIVEAAGGVPLQHKSGHAFIKRRMREADAVYGGEMSAHHYFRDFYYCDSGMIPWLLTMAVLSESGKSLSELVGERVRRFPCSGEINRENLPNAKLIARHVRAHYEMAATKVDEADGVSLEFGDRWRFNLRESNTEPTIRLNVESRGDRPLMESKTQEILELIDATALELKAKAAVSIRQELVLRVPRSLIKSVHLSVPAWEALRGRGGILRDRIRRDRIAPHERLPHWDVDEASEVTYDEHLAGLGLPPEQPLLVIGARNLGNNLRVVGYRRGEKLLQLFGEEADKATRPYWCMCCLDDGHLEAHALRFAGDTVCEVDGQPAALSDTAERVQWAVSGQPILWDGRTDYDAILLNSYDPRHYFNVPAGEGHHGERTHWGSNVEELATTLVETEDAAAVRRKALALGATRERHYLHSALGLTAEGDAVLLQSHGSFERIIGMLSSEGVTHAIELEHGGAVSTHLIHRSVGDHAQDYALLGSHYFRPTSSALLVLALDPETAPTDLGRVAVVENAELGNPTPVTW